MTPALATRTATGQVLGKTGDGMGVRCLLCGNLSVARLVNAWRRSDDIYLRVARSARTMQSTITPTTSHQLFPRSSAARLVFVVCTQGLIRLGLAGWLAGCYIAWPKLPAP